MGTSRSFFHDGSAEFLDTGQKVCRFGDATIKEEYKPDHPHGLQVQCRFSGDIQLSCGSRAFVWRKRSFYVRIR
jgi:hypothetical protein